MIFERLLFRGGWRRRGDRRWRHRRFLGGDRRRRGGDRRRGCRRRCRLDTVKNGDGSGGVGLHTGGVGAFGVGWGDGMRGERAATIPVPRSISTEPRRRREGGGCVGASSSASFTNSSWAFCAAARRSADRLLASAHARSAAAFCSSVGSAGRVAARPAAATASPRAAATPPAVI